MQRIKLSNVQPPNSIPKLDLDALLSMDDAVPTAPVPTAPVPTVKGRYDKYAESYPETLKIHLKKGSSEAFKQFAHERGFSSVSTMIRAAVLHCFHDPNFRKR